jgi:pyrimidine operon attenuation protein / uracil phosphoribosyltransferase
MNNKEINRLLDQMADDLKFILGQSGRTDPSLIGIHTGGSWIATQLQKRMGENVPLGELNIAFYRDDFSRIGMHPQVSPSKLPFDVEARDIVLVDDVLHTGRTIRAAMNEIFDYGRPASITLVVLVERSGHELPIKADIAGKTLALKPGEHAKLLGPEPLALEIKLTA